MAQTLVAETRAYQGPHPDDRALFALNTLADRAAKIWREKVVDPVYDTMYGQGASEEIRRLTATGDYMAEAKQLAGSDAVAAWSGLGEDAKAQFQADRDNGFVPPHHPFVELAEAHELAQHETRRADAIAALSPEAQARIQQVEWAAGRDFGSDALRYEQEAVELRGTKSGNHELDAGDLARIAMEWKALGPLQDIHIQAFRDGIAPPDHPFYSAIPENAGYKHNEIALNHYEEGAAKLLEGKDPTELSASDLARIDKVWNGLNPLDQDGFIKDRMDGLVPDDHPLLGAWSRSEEAYAAEQRAALAAVRDEYANGRRDPEDIAYERDIQAWEDNGIAAYEAREAKALLSTYEYNLADQLDRGRSFVEADRVAKSMDNDLADDRFDKLVQRSAFSEATWNTVGDKIIGRDAEFGATGADRLFTIRDAARQPEVVARIEADRENAALARESNIPAGALRAAQASLADQPRHVDAPVANKEAGRSLGAQVARTFDMER